MNEYNSPEMEVIVFDVKDVITTSDGWYKPGTELDPDDNEPGEDGW